MRIGGKQGQMPERRHSRLSPPMPQPITLDTYSHAIPAMQGEAAAKIAELVFAVK